MAKAKYDKSKPHMDIGTIGHVDHGKTTLTAATTGVLANKYPELNEFAPFDEVDNTPEERWRGITVNVSHVEYQTDKRHYAHADALGHANYIKNMTIGVAQMDGIILVVVVTDGPTVQTREYVLLACQAGVSNLIVAFNKADMVDDEEILELAEMGVCELLSSQEYDGDNIPVVHVSALKALNGDAEWVSSIEGLMSKVDNYFPNPVHDLDKPSLMPIEDVFTIISRGTMVTGRVECGLLNVNEEVEILGTHPTQKTTVIDIEMFHKRTDHADTDENCGLFLRDTKCKEVEHDQVVAKLGTIAPYTNSEVQVCVLKKEEGSRHNPFFPNCRPQLYFRTTDVTGVITLPEGIEMVMPGDNTEITVEFIQPTTVGEDLGSAVREGGCTVGFG